MMPIFFEGIAKLKLFGLVYTCGKKNLVISTIKFRFLLFIFCHPAKLSYYYFVMSLYNVNALPNLAAPLIRILFPDFCINRLVYAGNSFASLIHLKIK
jgi:hypothetical protein